MTPFNLFKLELACTLRSIDWEHDGKKFSVKFNLMDPPEEDRNQLFTVNTNEKGEYSIAEGKVEVDIPEKLKG